MCKNVHDKSEDQCCGCGACVHICPKKCISMQENSRGFLMPQVDKEQCISCGMCVAKCPENSNIITQASIEAYAATALEHQEHIKSTSGGVFGTLAEVVLEKGGIVSGCIYDTASCVKHICIEDRKDLDRLRQSKYVQSDTSQVYKEIKTYLEQNRSVLFSGTACQIAGLKMFLGKEYEKLYTVEVACHGVPSPGLFRNYIHWLEKKYKGIVTYYSFRNRDHHTEGEHYMSCAEFENGKRKYFFVQNDPYYGNFLAGATLRGTCYHCKYKSNSRIADITLCDFWGIAKEKREFPAHYGVTGVIIFTQKGQSLFASARDKLRTEECDANAIYKHNHSMLRSTSFDQNKRYLSCSEQTMDMLKKQLRSSRSFKKICKDILKRYIPERLKYKLRRLK